MFKVILAVVAGMVSWTIARSAPVNEARQISVFWDSSSKMFDVTNRIDTVTADAYGYYYTNYNNSGWNYLDAFMQNKVNSVEDHLRFSKAVGFLEVNTVFTT